MQVPAPLKKNKTRATLQTINFPSVCVHVSRRSFPLQNPQRPPLNHSKTGQHLKTPSKLHQLPLKALQNPQNHSSGTSQQRVSNKALCASNTESRLLQLKQVVLHSFQFAQRYSCQLARRAAANPLLWVQCCRSAVDKQCEAPGQKLTLKTFRSCRQLCLHLLSMCEMLLTDATPEVGIRRGCRANPIREGDADDGKYVVIDQSNTSVLDLFFGRV